jgi:peptide/nickel transport system substrate-binding protein
MAVPQGTLRVALTGDPDAIEVGMASDRNGSNVSFCIFNSLVWVDDDGKVVPALAESWTVSAEGTEYIFKLRQGVRFHNGEPLTADAVVFTWQRGIKDTIKYSSQFKIVKSVEKIDANTVRLTTEAPDPLLLRIIANDWNIIPPKYYKKVGEAGFLGHPVGTGPFRFVEWRRGDRIILEANADYWEEGVPKIQNLIFRPISESATRVAAIRAGEIDIVPRLSSEEANTLQNLPNVKVVEYPVDRVFYVAFNNLTSGKGTPTENPLVRQAMNYAVDVDTILEALFEGKGRPASGFVTSGNLGYDNSIKPFGYDPDKARELLKQAGYPNGFKMDFTCPTGVYMNFEQVCEAIQGYLGEIGIQTDLQTMESGRYWDLEAKKQLPPLFGESWSEEIGEAYTRLTGALGGMEKAYCAWYDPEIGRQLKEIGRTIDDDARAQLYVKLQRTMQENPPFIYLYELNTFEGINPRVKNYKPRPGEQYFLYDVDFTE